MAIPEDLTKVLDPDEQVEIYLEQKFYRLKVSIDSVVITNKRIILRHPHALGLKKNYTDFKYGDLANVLINTGIVRSTIKCTLKFGGEPLTLNDIPNEEAEKAYGIIRENISKFSAAASPKLAGPPMIFCKFCGAKNKPGDTRCINCGALLQ